MHTPVSYGKKLTFGAIQHLTEQQVGALVLTEVYRRMGIDVEIHWLPAKRAEIYAQQGKLDGEVMRIMAYGENKPSVVRVPTPYYTIQATAFVHKLSGIVLTSESDLKHYSIAKVRGVKNTDLITQGHERVMEANDTESMMKLLTSRLADIAITNRVNGLIALAKLDAHNIIAYPLASQQEDVYHYLHRDHENLLVPLDNMIRVMIQNGQMETLIKKSEIQVIMDRAAGK